MDGRSSVRKVTVSLPRRLLQYADSKAAEKGTSRSQWIADLIARAAACQRDELAAEGYQFYSQEAEEFACECLCATSEVIESCS